MTREELFKLINDIPYNYSDARNELEEVIDDVIDLLKEYFESEEEE